MLVHSVYGMAKSRGSVLPGSIIIGVNVNKIRKTATAAMILQYNRFFFFFISSIFFQIDFNLKFEHGFNGYNNCNTDVHGLVF